MIAAKSMEIMAESKLKVGRGLAYVITTGEPVFVDNISASGEVASVTRAVVTGNGIEHRDETFSVEQLETSYSNLKRAAQRQVDHEGLVLSFREKLEEKRYALPPAAIAAMNPQQHNMN